MRNDALVTAHKNIPARVAGRGERREGEERPARRHRTPKPASIGAHANTQRALFIAAPMDGGWTARRPLALLLSAKTLGRLDVGGELEA